MKLYYSPASPYVRKVYAAAIELGIKLELDTVADLYAADSQYGKVNPVHRVPSLRLDDGSMLFDSPVICDYLDSLGKGAKLIPPSGPQRWKVLRLQAMADGILDAAVPRRQETLRPPAQQSPERLSQYQRSIRQTLDALEKSAGELEGVTIGTLAVGCALGYLDFRFPGDEWRKGRAKLAAWYESFAKRPSMTQTVPKG
ncbi:MAG TPA: glutathione S-transferase N-terminal domain-containing protein [Candidatus Cybelea sp.]|nr:glutathione S-transferase N-terminal domain-containing protein [Candidatus Cybelea sp.]